MTRMMTRYQAAAALLCGALLTACEKNAVQDITRPEIPSAMVRFFNFGVGAPSVNFYANTTKMTAISASTCSPTPTDTVQQRLCREEGRESTTGVAYGGVGSGGLYAAIDPGDYTLKGTIAAATDKDLAIANLSASIQANKRYSAYLSGFYNTTTKTVDGFIVEDPLPTVDHEMAHVRFVNAISNSNPMNLTARDSTTKVETAVGATVGYKEAGAFVAVAPGLYEFYARVPGATTDLIERTGVTLVAGRIYTITSRGDITVGGTTAATRRFLDNTLNR